MSDMKIKKKYYMLVKGVYIKNLRSIEDFRDEELNEYIDNFSETANRFDVEDHYKSNPQTFINADSWPVQSNCKCWFCDRTFDTTPFSTVCNVIGNDVNTDPIQMNMDNFCSERCVLGYICDKYKGSYDKEDQIMLFKIFYRRLMGKELSAGIKPSPPRTIMKCYCGENGISPEEFNTA